MKVISPSPLAAQAAEVLTSFRDEVVVIGATAIEVALADTSQAITPTRDVDVDVPTTRADTIAAELERLGLRRSEIEHEAPFTWVRGDLRVQLVRTFHPFPSPVARRLPQNPVFGMASEQAHQVEVAFTDIPTALRLRSANAACLLALKQAAFGRQRHGTAAPVERDYHGAYLLISSVPDDVRTQLQTAGHEVHRRTRFAIEQLAQGGVATAAAARELVRLEGGATTQRQAETAFDAPPEKCSACSMPDLECGVDDRQGEAA